ncbi:Thiamine pyrophosphate-requiring enzymes [uncultured Rubrobacteraceae bacterium]|uniref:Thiamine pyrophosphate-requiring enzymes n=1 Tax=uncultured Rubrobacteraceae bacterium TaxID=349277 RepID=A0A6J4P7A9_9ACTN|nr:Thiamine pyrophosphate-requiring enzymes [uncultured Rubrobacteraceae bacterium]
MADGTTSKAGYVAAEVLARAGVGRLYTVPGESFLEILDAAEGHPDLSLISTRHESGASFMAEADAKLTGAPAVAMATRGVGASNLAIGVHTARQDSTPMLVLLGQVETDFLGREAFQEVDLTAFYAPITKWSATVNRADRLAEFVARGLRVATSGRPGPVMLALPADVLGERVPADPGIGVQTPPRPGPSPEQVRDVVSRLAAARRPVVIAGGGARNARGSLVSFAEAWDAGVYAAFRRQDVFPNEHPNYLGHLTLGTPPETLKALEEADLVLVIGCRLSEVTTQGYRLPCGDQAVIQVDIDPAEVGATVPTEVGMVSDAGAALAAFGAQAPSQPPSRNWAGAHGAYLESSTIPPVRASEGIDPSQVVGAMLKTLPGDALLTNDAGNFSIFIHRYWRHNHPGTQLAPTNGAMGYGVPAAVAAKLAAPDRTVVACCGDGGFLMTGQEMETAVRYGAPITVVVFRNGLQGTIALHQKRDLGRMSGVEIGEVDLAGYARSLGAEGHTVRDPDDLAPALEAALASDTVSLLDVVTDPDVISPTVRLSELASGTS